MTKTLDTYMMETGYYDTKAIMRDAGMNDRAAAFASIFGGTGEDTTVNDLSPEWQQLLDQARAHNEELLETGPPPKQIRNSDFISEWETRGSTTGE